VCDTRRMNEYDARPSDKRHRFPPEIIAHAVWRYCRFARSYRDVEELLAERGVVVTDETIRQWSRKFGQSYAHTLRRRRPRPGDKWHLDEVFMRSNGVTHSLWRAVDQEGNVRDILVQRRRNKAAAKKFFRRLLKGRQDVPRVLLTDKLASYGVAQRGALPGVEHRQHRRLNNRAENAHQPTRERARRMRRCKSPGHAQRFLAAYGPIASQLPPAPPSTDRCRLPRDQRWTFRHLAGSHRHPRHGLTINAPSFDMPLFVDSSSLSTLLYSTFRGASPRAVVSDKVDALRDRAEAGRR